MYTRHRSICALALLAGCAGAELPADSVTPLPLAIRDGQIETAFPAVGNIRHGADSKNDCTGTLVARDLVLSATHCGWFWSGNHTFSLTTDSGDAIEYKLDEKWKHPLGGSGGAAPYDVTLFRLVVPTGDSEAEVRAREHLDSITPVRVQPFEPRDEQRCLAVGYGEHVTGDGGGQKRSAYVIVDKHDETTIVVRADTGLAQEGDSGGPLFCREREDDPMSTQIVGVVHGESVGMPDDDNKEVYARLDDWAGRFIADWKAGIRPTPEEETDPEASIPSPDASTEFGQAFGSLCPNGAEATNDLGRSEVVIVDAAAISGDVDGRCEAFGTINWNPAFELAMPELCVTLSATGEAATTEANVIFKSDALALEDAHSVSIPQDGSPHEQCFTPKLAANTCSSELHNGRANVVVDIQVPAGDAVGVTLHELTVNLAQSAPERWELCSPGTQN